MDRFPAWLVVGALGLSGFVLACSGAPPADAPDYELDVTSGRAPAASSSGGSSSGDAPADEPAEEEEASTSSAGAGNGTSSSSGSPTSGSSTGNGSTTGTPPPEPTKVTVKIDGTTLNVDSTNLWSGVSNPGEYDVFIRITGPGVAAGSDIHISATRTGSGCDNTANYITYRPEGDTQYMPRSAKEPGCGLSITELPTAVNGRFKGSFNATLYGINTSTPKSKRVDVTFDVLRTK